jgi:hypothetical protein
LVWEPAVVLLARKPRARMSQVELQLFFLSFPLCFFLYESRLPSGLPS